MLMQAFVNECDITGVRFDTAVEGAAVLARGATGRWCQVLWLGPTAAADHIAKGGQVLSWEEAVSAVESLPGVNFVDF